MKFRLQLLVEGTDDRAVATDELACLERDVLGPATAGLTLDEGKLLLATCQKRMILAQARDYEDLAQSCSECATPRSVKGASSIILRKLFGALTIPCRRLYHCRCEGSGRSSFSPIAALFPERSTPDTKVH